MASLNFAHRLDQWLWLKGMAHPIVMPIVRNEILAAALSLILGLAIYWFTAWLFWFGMGLAIMALTFFSLAHFFLTTPFGSYTQTLLFKVLIRWAARLLLTVCLLFVALVLCTAPVAAILAGIVCATILALVTYAIYSSRR